jgi:hypothetical protein
MIKYILAIIFLLGFCQALPIEYEYDLILVESNTTCTTCEYVVDFVFTEVTTYNKTIHDVAELTKDLCDVIGGPIVKQECDFILNNLEKIFDFIQEGLNPEQVCEYLALCPSFI